MITPIHVSSVPNIPIVPFYSQFTDIQAVSWQKVGCGIASLAMIINYYKPDAASVNTLLRQGIATGAYDTNAGWIYKGLISLSNSYGLEGKSYDLAGLGKEAAFKQFKTYLDKGPVMVSIHYKFDPKSKIPHLVVIDGIDGDTIYYNDPASKVGQQKISKADFLKGWKSRFIVLTPTSKVKSVA